MKCPNLHRSSVKILVICCLVSLAGCGRKGTVQRVAVDGQILFGGQPLKSGRILFIPTDGTKGPAAVASVSEGKFQFTSRTGPVVGKNKVEIESTINPGFALDDEQSFAKAVEEKGDQGPVLPKQEIPAKYNRNSKLMVEVSRSGERTLQFELDAPPATSSSM